MATKSTSKRRKELENDDGGSTDRLSTLPDSLLCHILSFLPTRTSVATANLVSRRWRHLWQHLHVFDFEDDSHEDGNQPRMFRRFAFFVNAVLSLRQSRDIRKFRLSSGLLENDRFRTDCFNVWVRAAIRPQLELFLSISYCTEDLRVLLPSSLFNCTNLVSLSLVGAIHIIFQPSSIHLPSLKMLKIDVGVVEFDIDNIVEFNGIEIVDSVLVFLCGCPVLETLDILFCAGFLTKVPVPPFSKRLKLMGVSFSWTCLQVDFDWPGVDDSGSTIKTTLGIIGNLKSVEEAYLDVFTLRESEFVDPVLSYLRDHNGDLHLLLRHSTSKWPLRTAILNYPEFCYLNHLKFILPCFNTNLLLNVLEKCHLLQVIIIQISKKEPSPLRTWEPTSTTVPKCLESHLTYIHIEGYQGFEDELAFAEYILHNGLVLHTMLIFLDTSMDLANKNCSIKRLTDIPRGSVTCQLKFDSIVST